MRLISLVVLACAASCSASEDPAQAHPDPALAAVANPAPPSPPSPPVGSEDWWRARLAGAPTPPSGLSLQDAEKIHRYLDVGRFNTMGDQGMRSGTDYTSAAEKLNINIAVLKAADDYVHYTRMDYLTGVIKELLAGESELKPDYYNPIHESAFIGNYTVLADIVLKACKDENNLKERAKAVAQRLAELIKPAADGFKVGLVRYNCERLGTKGSLDFGLMWRKSDDKLREMPPWTGTYGREGAKNCEHWWSAEWNDRKVVKE